MEIEEKGTAREHDVDMEDVGALESSFTFKLSQFLFEKLAEARPEVENVGMKMLKTDEDDVDDMKKLVQDLTAFIVGEYSLGGVGDISTAVAVAQSASEYAEELLAPPETALLDAELLRQLQMAFSERYEGDAHVKFQAFLVRCWKAYKSNPGKYLSPQAALVQSSGFGKSRMLREVARITADDSSIQPTEADPVSMRVLYICTRDEKKSSGFPLATPELTKLFFGNRPKVDGITTRLLNTWQYAQEHWSDVGKDWLKLFSEQDADKAVADAIRAMSKKGPAQLNKDGGDRNRLLVLVVDEARSLFDGSEVDGTASYVYLQKALTMANETLFKQNSNCGGIFSVLVDTSSKVHDFVPLKENDPSSRAIKHKEEMAPFPPFVMTHNMDVFLRGRETRAANRQAEEKSPALDKETAAFDYRASVTCDDPGAHWNALVSMGRPLWKTFIDEHATLAFQQKAVSDLAASKLLMGQPISLDKSYNESTMQGTAALFCRLGLRPHSSAPIADAGSGRFHGRSQLRVFHER